MGGIGDNDKARDPQQRLGQGHRQALQQLYEGGSPAERARIAAQFASGDAPTRIRRAGMRLAWFGWGLLALIAVVVVALLWRQTRASIRDLDGRLQQFRHQADDPLTSPQ